MNKEVINYISRAKQAGQTNEQIKENLLMAGWKLADILIALVPIEQEVKTQAQSPIFSAFDNLPGISNLLKRTYEIYKNQFWKIAGLYSLIGILIAIQSVISSSAKAVQDPSLLMSFSFLILLIVIIIISHWFNISFFVF